MNPGKCKSDRAPLKSSVGYKFYTPRPPRCASQRSSSILRAGFFIKFYQMHMLPKLYVYNVHVYMNSGWPDNSKVKVVFEIKQAFDDREISGRTFKEVIIIAEKKRSETNIRGLS